MNVKVAHVMTKHVILTDPNHSVQEVRELLARHHINAVPVVGKNRSVHGIVTTTDLARRWKDETPVSRAMSPMVKTIKVDADVREAAHIMRTHRIHHLVVTDKNQVIGMLSSFDLLRLVEEYELNR